MSRKNLVVSNWVAKDAVELVATLMQFVQGRYQKMLPATVQFISAGEEALSKEAVKKGKTQYELDQFDYTVNRMGFRGEWTIPTIQNDKSTKIGVFGCSYTFGEGLPEDMLWHNVMADHIEGCRWDPTSVYNFGVSGSSASKIARLINLVTDFVDFDVIYVLLPQLGRTEVLEGFEASGDKRILFYDLVPNYPAPQAKKLFDRYYQFASEEFMQYEFIKNVTLIAQIGRAHDNTPIIISSWDDDTNDLLQQVPNLRVGPKFGQSKNQMYMDRTDTARDGLHAGPTAHKYFGERVAELIIPILKSEDDYRKKCVALANR